MISERWLATVWPSGAAREDYVSRQAAQAGGGLLLEPPCFTFDSLLPHVLEQAPLPPGRRALVEGAGPMLVQEILAQAGPGMELYAGLAAGRRLPGRLWRLLVEVKAAGLDESQVGALAAQASPRMEALARLLDRYEAALGERGLMDQADQLAWLEEVLAREGAPGELAHWQGLRACSVLWLRPLDQRLLAALARVMPVRVEFRLLPPGQEQPGLGRLMEDTAKFLESQEGLNLELVWQELDTQGGPLAGLAGDLLKGKGAGQAVGAAPLQVGRAGGRYGEVEALLQRARELLEAGEDPWQVGLLFPDLSLYGQMAQEVAGRLGVPLSLGSSQTLGSQPLAQALLELLSLPLGAHARDDLARVWASPYLARGLGRVLGVRPPSGGQVGRVLASLGYWDDHDTPLSSRRETGRPGQTQVLEACQKLKVKLEIFSQSTDLKEYISRVWSLVAELDLAGAALTPAQGAVLARDVAAAQELANTLASLERAAVQAGTNRKLTPGRCLALVRQALAETPLPLANSPGRGVRVLRLDQARGLGLGWVLIGGLAQGEFPAPPRGQHLLTSSDRLALGIKARMPVWRTDEEEYAGQMLVLCELLAGAGQGASLWCPAAGGDGRHLEPAFVWRQLAPEDEDALQTPAGGGFGQVPELAGCSDQAHLWARLASLVGRAPGPEAELAQATAWSLGQGAQGPAWHEVMARAAREEQRERLDLLELDQRLDQSGPFDGRLASPAALALLAQVLDQHLAGRVSPSSLESLAACPAAWFWSRVLGLGLPDEPDWRLDPSSEGQWVHAALARFFAPDTYQPPAHEIALAGRLEQCLDQAGDDLRAQGSGGHPLLWRARKPLILQALLPVVAREIATMVPARPWAVERDLGGEHTRVEVAQASGPPLVLQGRLDRLDSAPGLMRVTDYKHSKNTQMLRQAGEPELAGQACFQLPVYLAGARALAGGQDLALEGRMVSTRLPREEPASLDFPAGDAFFVLEPDARARLAASGTPNLFNAIAELWARAKSGRLCPTPGDQPCKYCDYAPLCRARVAPANGEAA